MENSSTGNGLFQIIKGAALALATSLLAAIVFASILRVTELPDAIIYPVNQTLKVLAVCLGTIAFVRGDKGFIKGGAIGLIFTALSYLTFSAIGGNFSLSGFVVAELLLNVAAGAVGGIIAVNVK